MTIETARDHVTEQFLEVRDRLRVYALSLTRDRDRAEDLLQDAFVRAVEKADQYKPDTNFSAWIFTLMRNRHYDGVRRLKNQPHVDIDGLTIPISARQEDGIRLGELARLLWKLPKQNRAILLMAGLEEMSLDEISGRTGIKVGTIKSKISRSRDFLRGAAAEGARAAA
jgi:RNA polymerase sigma-70 factor (ECF subfamily)